MLFLFSPLVFPLAAIVAVKAQHNFTVSGAQNCTSFTAPITASANNTRFTIPVPQNDEQLVQLNINEWASGSTYLASHVDGPLPVNGTYDIYMKYCEPIGGTSKAVLQLTHGLSCDNTYWDVSDGSNTSYSFVDAAVNAGYATLAYDRLGLGKSLNSLPDGLEVVQGALETSIAIEIGQGLKDGSLGVGNYSKVVGIGHSFGSVINVAVASTAPSLLDAIILTGYSANISNNNLLTTALYGEVAAESDPTKLKGWPPSYLRSPSQSTDQYGFFHYPNFTKSILDHFTETKTTWTLGEYLTFSVGWFSTPASSYNKPLFVVTGQNDGGFCDGNCFSAPNGTTQLDSVRTVFPAASVFNTYVVPDTGHGINFHTTAAEAYARIVSWLGENGL